MDDYDQHSLLSAPPKRAREGHSCPLGCRDNKPFHPLILHFAKVHLGLSKSDLSISGEQAQCSKCHLRMRRMLLPLHLYLHHETELPEIWQQRYIAVGNGEDPDKWPAVEQMEDFPQQVVVLKEADLQEFLEEDDVVDDFTTDEDDVYLYERSQYKPHGGEEGVDIVADDQKRFVFTNCQVTIHVHNDPRE